MSGSMSEMLERLEAIAVEAGALILSMRDAGVGWRMKDDGSPCTEADRRGEDVIVEGLEALALGRAIVAEERTSDHGVQDVGSGAFFLVDALDGTKEYIKGSTDFTVNIALIEGGVPVLGVVAAPARGELYSGIASEGAWRRTVSAAGPLGERQPINARAPAESLVAVASASHLTPATTNLLDALSVTHRVSAGSSLKFCLVASGVADIYPRLGRTMQWDTAAGDAVVRAAGGTTFVRGASVLGYGPRQGGTHPFENPEFIVVGRKSRSMLPRLKAAGWI
jgi:3'(2'), 5'-bisphosphate nucleotidase